MKKTISKTLPAYKSFIGEFSRHWVAVRTINGDVTHSVQRPRQSEAETAVRSVDAPGGPHDVPRFA